MLESLGPYRIDRELGSGAMGTVYEAHDDGGNRVAVKLVHPHLLSSEGFAERFLREAEIGQRIDHPNVIRTLGAGEHDGRPFIALEFVVGGTLHELRMDLHRVPETLCRHIGREAANGLDAIHALGIVHRDVKPENILITPDHEVRLMDLGLARAASGADRLTLTGQVVGTPAYCPPEQFLGLGELDVRSDLYSLGATLYELATGQQPFSADSLPALVHKVLHEAPARPGRLCTQLSPFFEELLLALLDKDPSRRLPSAERLARVLEGGERSDWWSEQATRIVAQTRRPLRRIRIPRETECVGRDDDLAALRAAFDAAKSGDGRVVLLEGEAGIGKSRLIDELVRRLEAAGEDINFLFGSYPPGGAATAAGAFTGAYHGQLGNEGSSRYLTENPMLVPAFDALLRGETTPKGAEPLSKDALQTCFARVTQALARERVAVIAIDDLHFAPNEGRALFASLAAAVPGHAILLVGTARPGLSLDWYANLERLDHVTRSQVERLGSDDVSRILEPVIGSSPGAEQLAGSIAATADGNPFFLFEIVRSLRESGVLTRGDDGSWATTSRISEIAIPETVQSLLDARIERLSDEERELLDCAACWGFEFDGRLVAEALGMRRLPALRVLGRLEQKHGLVRAAGAGFAFDHHAIQEHLYARLARALREELHAALAEALEDRTGAAAMDPEALDGALCVDLCTHSLDGARGVAAKRYLPAAHSHLQTSYQHAHAAELVERALAAPGLLAGADRANTLLRLAGTLQFLSRMSRMEETLREAEGLADQIGDAALSRRVQDQLAALCFRTAHREEADTHYERALELAESLADPDVIASQRLRTVWSLYCGKRIDEARERLNRSLAFYREVGDAAGEAWALFVSGQILFDAGRQEEAAGEFERSVALYGATGAQTPGAPTKGPGEAAARLSLGFALGDLGRHAESEQAIESAIALHRAAGDRMNEAHTAEALAEQLRDRGRVRRAREIAERCVAIQREIGWRFGESLSLYVLGRLLADEGDDAGALRAMESSVDASGEDAQHVASRTMVEIGSLLAASGDVERARDWLTKAREKSMALGGRRAPTLARCELAALPGGDVQDALNAVDEFGESLANFQGEDLRRARLLLWRATGDSAHLDEAKRLLDELLANSAPDDREAIATNLRVNREILAAWGEEFGEEGDAPEAGSVLS